ncbi:MAG: PTS sugar transporter subunit IIA, partial [Phycisphaerae bacterium]|nr:PTS sugar transporter subunit IIA [Phycisphaerae bacterium]
MPHTQMNSKDVAAYLGMDLRDVERHASREKIPCRRVGERYIFTKGEVDHWVWRQMHNWEPQQLADIERGVSEHHGFVHGEPIVCPLVSEKAVAVPLVAKTREAVIRGLVQRAVDLDVVFDRDSMLDELRGREALCSTALLPGVAFPHPRRPLPHDIAESFITVGLTPAGVPFGAEDGKLTRLFFFLACKDDRTHLHVLARLVRMLDDRGTLEALMAAESPEQLEERLAHREME